ncbi:MAG TPA: PfkB family carbohydrate kinase, partial [Methanocorpusculum sp.]|nr:PfkB family carbohydrate kinase [Methanocorpusculum sp.]
VSAVDPTGAGDAYRAGLFTAWKKGFDLADACKVGAVVSSFAVEKIGTQTNLPTWDEMAARFEKAFGELPQ